MDCPSNFELAPHLNFYRTELLSDKDGKLMQIYRVEETEQSWRLYRARFVRPAMEATSLDALIELATPMLSNMEPA